MSEWTELSEWLERLHKVGEKSENLFPISLTMEKGDSLVRYYFLGPGSRSSAIRVGIFAGIHGDEAAGVYACLRFLEELAADPERGMGYELFVYPICNPVGFRRGTRESLSGLDLNREFWKNSEEEEVRLLERQLETLRFDGIVALHSDDTSAGLYGFVKGHALTRDVLEPALALAERVLPRNYDKRIDNFEADAGVILDGYPGIIGAPEAQWPKPFEIVFETPHLAPMESQVEATCVALQEILDRFRVLISEAQNI